MLQIEKIIRVRFADILWSYMQVHLDDLSEHYEFVKSLPAKAKDIYHTHQQKKYRYIGMQEFKFGCCAILLRILVIASISMAIFCTLGLVLLNASFRAITNRVSTEVKTRKYRIGYYALHNLENWCFLKCQDGNKILDTTFSIKKFWDKSLCKQWWNGKIASKDLYAIYNRIIAGRNLPSLMREIEIPFKNVHVQAASMPGVSLIANFLSIKTKQDELHVCQNLQAFQKKLKEIKNNEEDQRLVLITPTHFSMVNPDKKATCELHKVAVCIEKKEGKIKIGILDSTPYVVNPTQIHLEKGNFSTQDLIFSYMKSVNFPVNTEFYTPYVVIDSEGNKKEGDRQFAVEGGCSTFALRDGIAFLRDHQFFDNLSLVSGRGTVEHPFLYNNLPPNFMKTTQSWSKLNRYASLNEELTKKPLGTSPRNLIQTMEHHKMEVDGKLQNWLVSRRTVKYQLLLIFLLNHYSDEEIQTMMKQKFVT